MGQKQEASKFLLGESHGYRVFVDCLVRTAVEAFSKKEFRESGQFASQPSKVLAFFYHLQLHESLLIRKKLQTYSLRHMHSSYALESPATALQGPIPSGSAGGGSDVNGSPTDTSSIKKSFPGFGTPGRLMVKSMSAAQISEALSPYLQN